MTTQIKFKMSSDNRDLMPKKAHANDAAYDLRSSEIAVVLAGEVKMVKTGLFLELPDGYEAQVRPRSGLAFKNGITVHNSPGTVDAGYRGEVGVILFNASKNDFSISRGDRIAQMVIQKLSDVELVLVEELADSQRGSGGFGSTGHK